MDGIPGRAYKPNTLEVIGDSIVKVLRFCWSVTYYSSPVLLVVLYRRGIFTRPNLTYYYPHAITLNAILIIAVFIRSVGRYMNKEYFTFIKTLQSAKSVMSTTSLRQLAKYDFDFSQWPVNFKCRKSNVVVETVPKNNKSLWENITDLPCRLLSYVVAHTFGCMLLYPGATSLVQTIMWPALLQGRSRLIEEKKGQRAKLVTADNNEIDTMYVDRRNDPDTCDGKVLVVCCEGNSGFYEVGCMNTPLEAGYSVLGWNHPGFGGSTGVPWPHSEQNAIDAVMQYTIQKLHYQPENIVLFAWSIGGYTATWAAKAYPDVKYVVLDATFDDIVPLATAKMPESWRSLVTRTVKSYMRLDNARQLCQYPGPVLLIRRSRDEMITTRDPTELSSNRSNDVLMKLLKHRYPNLVDETTKPYLKEWLQVERTKQAELMAKHNVCESDCCKEFPSQGSYPDPIGEGYPLDRKVQLMLFLASKYMDEFDSTHCTQLPTSMFRKPWMGECSDDDTPEDEDTKTTGAT
ncbi:Phosphatidylserine lipase ABHD16A [Lamellibrachia satsuma]|nr:Phosphatidylserine lipase ABHD16A [Lamellibrachia satsuma]